MIYFFKLYKRIFLYIYIKKKKKKKKKKQKQKQKNKNKIIMNIYLKSILLLFTLKDLFSILIINIIF